MTAAITDFTHFTDLRRGAETGSEENLREVAGQFEALFIQTMLKSMREASMGDSLFGDNEGHEMYKEMLDQQFALELASGKGIGLADVLVRQMGGEEAAKTPDSQGLRFERTERNQALSEVSPAWKTPESFARDVWPHAQRVARELNVPPEGVLAQAALETGWGKHVIPNGKGESSFNLFGVKASGSWSGDSVVKQTIEFDAGTARQERADFRAYDDIGQTFDDYAALLSDNPRYSDVRGHGGDVDGFAGALQQSGYATDPLYADKISRVANSETMNRVLGELKNAVAVPIGP